MDKLFKLPRWLLFIISMFLLLSASIYSWYHEKDEYSQLKIKIRKPEKYASKKIHLAYIKIIDINKNMIKAKNRGGDIFILYPANDIQEGGYYSFTGEINPDGRIKIINRYHHSRWVLKHIISLLSLIFVFYYIYKYIRFDKKRYLFYIEET